MAKERILNSVLIPIISKKEDNPDFLTEATKGFEQVFLLAVIDQSELVGQFGFVATEIRTATQIVEKIKAFLESQGKKTEEIIEWGSTIQKIVKIAEIRNCNKIVLVKQDNQHFKKLIKQIEENTSKKIELLSVAVTTEKKQ